jgi:hypothetical protein
MRQPRLRVVVAGLAVTLGGCSGTSPSVSEPPPTVRQLVAGGHEGLFIKGVDARNIAVGPDRIFETALGPQRGACLRASVLPVLGNGIRRTVTYVVMTEGHVLGDRRPAQPPDQCDKDLLQPTVIGKRR